VYAWKMKALQAIYLFCLVYLFTSDSWSISVLFNLFGYDAPLKMF